MWQQVVRDDAIIVVRPSADDHLYLTQAEMSRLVETIRQELVCRTTDRTDEPVLVADAPLTAAEAWRLVDKLENSLTDGQVDWPVEGF